MNNLAEIYHHQNRFDESESLFNKVLELRRRVLGPTHPNTINVLASLGELKLERHEYDAAEPLLREAFNSYEKTNSDSWRRYYAESMLGAALMDLYKYVAAEPLLASGYRGMQERRSSIPFENQSSLKAAREWLAKLYQSEGKQEQAAKLQ
jgi:tetratricopeptide (TPR) repeat protein